MLERMDTEDVSTASLELPTGGKEETRKVGELDVIWVILCGAALSRDGLQPTLLAMASNRVAMASNIRAMAWFLAFQVPSAHVTGHETHLASLLDRCRQGCSSSLRFFQLHRVKKCLELRLGLGLHFPSNHKFQWRGEVHPIISAHDRTRFGTLLANQQFDLKSVCIYITNNL